MIKLWSVISSRVGLKYLVVCTTTLLIHFSWSISSNSWKFIICYFHLRHIFVTVKIVCVCCYYKAFILQSSTNKLMLGANVGGIYSKEDGKYNASKRPRGRHHKVGQFHEEVSPTHLCRVILAPGVGVAPDHSCLSAESRHHPKEHPPEY